MEFYASICRLCESPGQSSSNWTELYVDKNEHLLPKIRACANIVIHEHDELPRRICSRCHQTVEQAYNFKLQCEITDAKLRYEIDYMKKNAVKGKDVTVPPFDYGQFLQARDQLKSDVTLNAEKVYVKTEPIEEEEEEEEQEVPLIDEDFCTTNVEAELKDDSDKEEEDQQEDEEENDGNKEGDKSDGSDSEQDSDWFDKAIGEKPNGKKRGPTVCDICGEQFRRKYDMHAHKRTVHGKSQHQCKQCLKCFSRRSRLEDHEVLHSGIRQFECQDCDKKYATQSGLRTHIEDCHTENLPYVCDKCGKGFSKEGKLRYHYAVHIETRDFICDICEKGFKTPAHLTWHKTIHLPQDQKRKRNPRDRQKICVCPFCGKVSTTSNTHTMHLRTHTGEQRYECHICFKRFTSSGSHKKHLRVHSGEKPYVCQYCQKPFRQKHHMDTHIRGVHTNEKPYKCKYCPRAFATLGNMRLHEKSHGMPASIVKSETAVTFPDVVTVAAAAPTIHSPASQSSSVMMISSTPSPVMNPGVMIPPVTSGFNLYLYDATQ